MTAKGKINASKVQSGDRIIIEQLDGGQIRDAVRKTGENVEIVQVVGKTFRAAQGRFERQGKYVIETTAGTFEAAAVQTMILAPEDAAGIKRAHAEALVENDRRDAEAAERATTAQVEEAVDAAARDAAASLAQGRAWFARHIELGTDASREAYATIAYREADHAEALAIEADQRERDLRVRSVLRTDRVQRERRASAPGRAGEAGQEQDARADRNVGAQAQQYDAWVASGNHYTPALRLLAAHEEALAMNAARTADLPESVVAEKAALGVLLWPVRSPEFAPNYTLAEVQIRRRASGTFVTWVYESGTTRDFALGERVTVRTAH